MKKNTITQLMLYRYRYAIGYGVFAVALLNLLVIAGLFIPGGISQAEMQTAAQSAGFSLTDFQTWPIIDLPYHLLQKTSIELFGLSDFSIKLPSLILAFLTGVGFLLLLLQWFKQNVAVLAAIIAVTASQFLIVAQSGTATILLMFWSTFLLLAATYVSVHAKGGWGFFWKLVFFICTALSLYTPMSIYVLVAMFIAVLSHPHLRYMLLRLSYWKLGVCLALACILLVPLILHAATNVGDVLTLLALPQSLPSLSGLLGSFIYLGHALFGFTAPVVQGEVLLPLYGLSAMALMLLGLFQLAVDHHSARTYTIALWMIILGILLVLQPQYIAIIFIPMLLMLAIGINTLFGKWYGLFPRNPYARIAALLPLAILMGGIVFTGADRFMNSYRYSPSVAETFSKDLTILNEELKKEGAPKVIVVPTEEHAFYSALAVEDSELVVTDATPLTKTPAFIANSVMNDDVRKEYGNPNRVITNSYSDNSLRFYLYK